MPNDVAALETLFLGLADKTRLRLLGLMAHGPVSVGHLAGEIGESQPKVSRHLAYLRNAGLVTTTRDGKWIYYELSQLGDGSADTVFRCIVDELSAKPRRGKQTQRPSEQSPIPDRPAEDRHDQEYEYEEEWGSVPSMEPEWDAPSDDRGADLDIFLL